MNPYFECPITHKACPCASFAAERGELKVGLREALRLLAHVVESKGILVESEVDEIERFVNDKNEGTDSL